MAEFIDRQKAIEQIKAEWAKLPLAETTGFGILMRVLTSIPAADVRFVARGKWRPKNEIGDCCYQCSDCGFVRDAYILDIGNFCPNCGARMEES